MCNDVIYSSVERVVKQRLQNAAPRCLDIGAGAGDLLKLLRESWPKHVIIILSVFRWLTSISPSLI
jgi:trans-aconitate methyltransferase